MSASVTLLDALAEAITAAGLYNSSDQVAPAAILWPDKECQWAAVVPRLAERLPLLTLGDYVPEQRKGPAYWIRCVLAGTLPEVTLPLEQIPIIYLPGISRQEIRAVEECPRLLQPLVELQYRGVLWTQRNGRDWTIAAFLQNKEGGLALPVASDQATREALLRALPRLVDESVAALRQEAPLQAAWLDVLLNPDEVRRILLWLNDPAGYRKQTDDATWQAFGNLCRQKYAFHPDKEGPIAAAKKLSQPQGPWQVIWQRYSEAPASYPNLPQLLRQARPSTQLALFEKPVEYWPQDNENAESALRERLLKLENALPNAAAAEISALEAEHGERRQWVWADLGQTPLAQALVHLHALAVQAQQPLAGGAFQELAERYSQSGWQTDAAVLRALQSVQTAQDVQAVKVAVRALYLPWLEQGALAFQQAVAKRSGGTYRGNVNEAVTYVAAGTCLLFCDGLRWDVGQDLLARLIQQGLEAKATWRFAALPTVTATAKPAASPVSGFLAGVGRVDLTPVVSEGGGPVTAPILRKVLADEGYQPLLSNELGDPTGLAWTEIGAIDQYGHTNGWKLAQHVTGELDAIRERVVALLDHGWKQVIVLTDHGWLLLPGKLPKVELPLHLSHMRKGRCAVMKEDAQTTQQMVAWHWDSQVRIAVATGISCYEEGKEYEHGGLSPQECVVPLITVQKAAELATSVTITAVAWRGLRCSVDLSGYAPGLTVDIRTHAAQASSSCVAATKPLDTSGRVTLLVDDDDKLGMATLVVLVNEHNIVQTQWPTMIGG